MLLTAEAVVSAIVTLNSCVFGARMFYWNLDVILVYGATGIYKVMEEYLVMIVGHALIRVQESSLNKAFIDIILCPGVEIHYRVQYGQM